MVNLDLEGRLIKETIQNRFEENRFIRFIRELFDLELENKKNQIWGAYSDYIEHYNVLGSYTDSSRNNIGIVYVRLKKPTSLERARTTQRDFIAEYLERSNNNAALVAFYGDDPSDWRLSFVKLEYILKDDTEKIKTEKRLTPVKRYSFLVGENEPSHTCQKQLLELLRIRALGSITINDLEKAFSIDAVTVEFFEEYKARYLELKENLDDIVKNDQKTKHEFEEKGITTTDFAKKLLGQIVFLYFLQKKGWLGVEKDQETGVFNKWGTGPKNFMKKLFDNKATYKIFFNDVLEPLFYEALAKQRDNDYYSKLKCKVPFLDGGLFEQLNDYDWTAARIPIQNNQFQRIFDTFDRFNFTVKEDEPLEKEVAVDPEMLGKVFENLLEVTDRKSKGAFYTPREIVNYMCNQSLINYLETNTDINREYIEKFIDQNIITEQIKINYLKIDQLLKDVKVVDPAVGSGAFPVGIMIEIVKARTLLTQFFDQKSQKYRTNYTLKRETIENCLYGVDIETSAIEIAKLRFWLSLVVDEDDLNNVKPLPNLDHKLMVGNSLIEEYKGVKLFDDKLLGPVQDIKNKEITNIEKTIYELKIQKGLVASGRARGNIKKLKAKISGLKSRMIKIKNKSTDESQYKFSQDFSIKESQKKFAKLKRLQNQLFNAQNRNDKNGYKKEIDKIEWELIEETLKEQDNEAAIEELKQIKRNKSKPFFLWKLNFFEVFQKENPGFDIVIANPPYVRQEEIKEYKEAFRRDYEIFNSIADLYTYFYERGVEILRREGTLTFISSNKFMRARYGINLRNFLKSNTTIQQIIDFGSIHMFEAITNTAIVITRNGYSENNKLLFSDKITFTSVTKINQDELDESAWTLADNNILELKSKIEKNGIVLSNWNVEINRGLLTGFNDAFVIDTATKERFCKDDPKNKEIIKPIIRGRDIGKYFHRWNGLWVIFIPWHFPLDGITEIQGASKKAEKEFEIKYPTIYKHLLNYKKELSNRNESETGIRYEWYALQRYANTYIENFKKEKIIWIELTDKSKFAYSDKEAYVLARAFLMTGESLKYLLAFLNSRLCTFYFKLICNSSGMGTIQWKKFAMDKIPIPKLLKEDEQPFNKIVDQIISITENDDYLNNTEKQAKVKILEKDIDLLIYKLYKLTPKEIELIED